MPSAAATAGLPQPALQAAGPHGADFLAARQQERNLGVAAQPRIVRASTELASRPGVRALAASHQLGTAAPSCLIHLRGSRQRDTGSA